MHARMWEGSHVYTCRGQRPTLGVVPQVTLALLLGQDLFWSGTPRPKQSTLAGLSPNFLPSNEIVTMVSKAAYMGPGDEFRSSCLHGKALYWLSYPKTFLQYFNMQ